MYRLPFFRNGRSTPINEEMSPIRTPPRRGITTPSPIKTRDYAYSPARPPRPTPLFDSDESPTQDILRTHSRSTSEPLSSLPSANGRFRSSSTPQLVETSPIRSTPEHSPPPKRHSPESKKRPVALKLRTSNLSKPPRTPTPRGSDPKETLRDLEPGATPPNDLSVSVVFTPEKPHHTPSRSFENVPLPWGLVSLSTLTPSATYTYIHTPPPPSPRVLPPFALSTCHAESSRLTSELDRLKAKYAKLLSQRDHTLYQLQHAASTDIVQLARTLEKQMGRCDRLARQMYVCNDQIRQMDSQVVEHKMGIWRLGQEAKMDARRHTIITLNDISFPLPPNRYDDMEDDSSDCGMDSDMITTNTHDPDSILILPPSHRRSASVPFVDMPHTPYLDHRKESGGALMPRPSGTAPLRLARSRGGRSHSLTEGSQVSKKLPRESEWVTSQAILLSLATARMWTGEQ